MFGILWILILHTTQQNASSVRPHLINCFHQTPSEGSQQAKVLAKVLAANRDPWKPNLPMGQIPKNWNITDSAGCINPR
jgi:hypothetical protein